MNDLAAALRAAMAGEVRADKYTRHLFSRDASMYSIEPLAVAFPRDAADVAAAVAVCAQLGVPLLPRGAGTSLAGQTVGRGVIIDTSRHMDRIVELDAAVDHLFDETLEPIADHDQSSSRPVRR